MHITAEKMRYLELSPDPGAYRVRRLKVDGDRLNKTLHETCKWGAAHRWGDKETETGMCRLALTDDDKKVRDWFVSEMLAVGCKVNVDEMGNMFAVRPGRKNGPPTAMGSHLDTQPRGGRYDGILGVMSAVEVMRTLHDAKYTTEYPLVAITWTNEEGARFQKSVNGSAVWGGELSLEESYELKDSGGEGLTARSELKRIGYLGKTPCSHEKNPIAAHFEIHIEQGPVLEGHGERVGVVQGGPAWRWSRVRIHGRDGHAGGTPYEFRADAAVAMAKFVLITNEVGRKYGALVTSGILRLDPGSINTIPNMAETTLDIRHANDAGLKMTHDEIEARTKREILDAAPTKWNKVTIEWETLFENTAAHFHPDCKNIIKEAALANVPEHQIREMVSGAGHDSCVTSRLVPTGMIFVPSRDGLSHNPMEYTSPEDCALGAQVLLDSVLLYDSRRKE